MSSEYLYYLTFILFKFTFKNFIFFEMMFDTILSPIIFQIKNMFKLNKLII